MTEKNKGETPPIYAIRIQNHLDQSLMEWFEGMSITYLENGQTVLCGPVVDQSALHGLLVKIRQFNLILISVKEIDPYSWRKLQ